jgi:hypothetical protein
VPDKDCKENRTGDRQLKYSLGKPGTVCAGRATVGREGAGRRVRWWCVLRALHVLTGKRTKKPPATALGGVGRGLRRETIKNNRNCLYEPPHIMNISY